MSSLRWIGNKMAEAKNNNPRFPQHNPFLYSLPPFFFFLKFPVSLTVKKPAEIQQVQFPGLLEHSDGKSLTG